MNTYDGGHSRVFSVSVAAPTCTKDFSHGLHLRFPKTAWTYRFGTFLFVGLVDTLITHFVTTLFVGLVDAITEFVKVLFLSPMRVTRLLFKFLLTFSVGLPQLQLHRSRTQNSKTHVVGDSLKMKRARTIENHHTVEWWLVVTGNDSSHEITKKKAKHGMRWQLPRISKRNIANYVLWAKLSQISSHAKKKLSWLPTTTLQN